MNTMILTRRRGAGDRPLPGRPAGGERWRVIALLSPLLALLAACAGPAPPDRVARDFWAAMARQDLAVARHLVTISQQNTVAPLGERYAGFRATLGRIVIDGDEAVIDTVLRVPAGDESADRREVAMQTRLRREDGIWRVDYRRTMETLPPAASIEDLAQELQALGRDVTEGLGDIISRLEQRLPELERDLNELGEETTRDMEKAWRKQLPKLKRMIEELRRAIRGKDDEGEEPPSEQETI